MGIYDRGKGISLNFRFNFAWKRVKYPLLGIAVVVAVAALTLLVVIPALQPKPIVAVIDPNPLDLTQGHLNSYLTVTVTNISGETANNVPVRVQTEHSELIIFPEEKSIETIASGNSRTLSPFAIRTNPNANAYSGTYTISISTEINGQSFSEDIVLELRTV